MVSLRFDRSVVDRYFGESFVQHDPNKLPSATKRRGLRYSCPPSFATLAIREVQSPARSRTVAAEPFGLFFAAPFGDRRGDRTVRNCAIPGGEGCVVTVAPFVAPAPEARGP